MLENSNDVGLLGLIHHHWTRVLLLLYSPLISSSNHGVEWYILSSMVSQYQKHTRSFNGLVKACDVISLTKHVIHHHGHQYHSGQFVIRITNTRCTNHPPLSFFHIGFTKECREVTYICVLLERDNWGLELKRMDDSQAR